MCTANDVKVSEYEAISIDGSPDIPPCVEGETGVYYLKAKLVANAGERYDIGLFINENGGDAKTDPGENCYRDLLSPVSGTNSDLNIFDGSGPFYNGEITQDPADVCGDIQQNQETFKIVGPISVKCVDTDGDEKVDIGTCVSWDNAASDGSDKKPSCLSAEDVVPNTKSKCRCERVIVSNLDVAKSAMIKVIKDIVPDNAPGSFVLEIAGDGFLKTASDVGDGVVGEGEPVVALGPEEVPAGTQLSPGATYTIGETQGTPALENYDTSIVCSKATGEDPISCSSCVSIEVTVMPSEDWTCIVTNQCTCTPSIEPEAKDETVECDGSGNNDALTAWLSSNGGAEASDACGGGVVWTHDFTALSDDCGATGSATVTFTATNDCGFTATTAATFTIVDTTPPSIEPEASDETVECDGSGNNDALTAWLSSNGGAEASDACGGGVVWTHDFTALSDDCGATGSATVTFTATDDCGFTATTAATFTIVDTTEPVIDGCPADDLINICLNPVPAAAELKVTDNCQADFTVQADCCFDGEGVKRTWKAMDSCGNKAIDCVQKITFEPDCETPA